MRQKKPTEKLEPGVIAYLKRHGESSTANIGDDYFPSNGNASNPGTLAVSSVLRSLKKRGIVSSRFVSGRGWGRTLWQLTASQATEEGK